MHQTFAGENMGCWWVLILTDHFVNIIVLATQVTGYSCVGVEYTQNGSMRQKQVASFNRSTLNHPLIISLLVHPIDPQDASEAF